MRLHTSCWSTETLLAWRLAVCMFLLSVFNLAATQEKDAKSEAVEEFVERNSPIQRSPYITVLTEVLP